MAKIKTGIKEKKSNKKNKSDREEGGNNKHHHSHKDKKEKPVPMEKIKVINDGDKFDKKNKGTKIEEGILEVAISLDEAGKIIEKSLSGKSAQK